MDFINQIKEFSKKIESIKDDIRTEEATKTSIIMPFFHILGYDIFNPKEFLPEFTADVGIKKGEKVDYAIILNGIPTILIEAKSIQSNLDKYGSQLFRYFSVTEAKFAILTNGISYRFYTDLEETNKMDKEPFLEIDLLNLKEDKILELKKFVKSNFNLYDIFNNASLLKYANAFKNTLSQQLQQPTDDFVKLFLKNSYTGAKTQTVIEKFRPILKKALNDFINEMMNDKIKAALEQTNQVITDVTKKENKLAATKEELKAFSIVKSILQDIIDNRYITYKILERYFAVLYQNNTRKWICRFIITDTQNLLILPDENKKEIRYHLSDIDNIYNYKSEIVTVLKRYLETNKIKPQEIIYTTKGNFTKPEPYIIDFERVRIKKKT